jgi:putative endonuclease
MRLKPLQTPFQLSLGKRGEMAAADHLRKNGYKILEQNYRCEIGEIDIIAKKEGRLLFIEVKTRKSDHFGVPEESVHTIKQQKIFRTAEWYLKQNKAEDKPVGFEVVAVDWYEDRDPGIRCIPNAFHQNKEL